MTIAVRLMISTQIVSSTELGAGGSDKTERLVQLVRAVGGTTYLSGPSTAAYLDLRAFEEASIAVEYKSYEYAPYPQLWGPFEGAVSIWTC